MSGQTSSVPSNLGQIRSLVTIDSKGQMVITKEIRKALNLQPGDKLAVFTAPNPIHNAEQRIIMVKVEDILDKKNVEKITAV